MKCSERRRARAGRTGANRFMAPEAFGTLVERDLRCGSQNLLLMLPKAFRPPRFGFNLGISLGRKLLVRDVYGKHQCVSMVLPDFFEAGAIQDDSIIYDGGDTGPVHRRKTGWVIPGLYKTFGPAG